MRSLEGTGFSPNVLLLFVVETTSPNREWKHAKVITPRAGASGVSFSLITLCLLLVIGVFAYLHIGSET